MVLTDHSPRLTVAHGLDRERLRQQLDVIDELNAELAPFRILTGIEVDILDDGALDQDDDLLGRLDVVVASVHSKLRMERQPMTERMVLAVVAARTSTSSATAPGAWSGKRRPSRRSTPSSSSRRAPSSTPPSRSTAAPSASTRPTTARAGARLRLQVLDRHRRPRPRPARLAAYGCERAAECEVPLDSIVNTMTAEDLVDWAGSHA